MQIFQVTVPGSPWPIDENGNKSQEAFMLVHLLKESFLEATLTLDLYNEANAVDAKLRHYESFNDRPALFWRKALFLHARSFVFAFDNFAKALYKLSKLNGASAPLALIISRFEHDFPGIKGVRDTAHHLEDRALNLNKKGKQIERQPVPSINPNLPSKSGGQAGSLVLGGINENDYGSTLNDGSYGSVSVTADSVARLRDFLQEVIDTLSWESTSFSHQPSKFPS